MKRHQIIKGIGATAAAIAIGYFSVQLGRNLMYVVGTGMIGLGAGAQLAMTLTKPQKSTKYSQAQLHK